MTIQYFKLMIERLREETGQTSIEYGLVIVLVAVVLALALQAALGDGGVITDITDAIGTAIDGALS